MTDIHCDASPIVNMMQSIINRLKMVVRQDSSKNKELNLLQTSLKKYLEDCSICKKEADNDYKCQNMALTKLMRQFPLIRDSIYPWKNYDWDYANFIDNNYSAQATGSSPSGSAYMKNIGIFMKFLNAYFRDANPNDQSIAGGTDKNSDYPIYGCMGNQEKYCKAFLKVKNKDQQNPPYNDSFFSKNLNGEQASSYYIRVGSCQNSSITNPKECVNKKLEWKDGQCIKPRYAYIDNSSGLFRNIPLKGMFPSLTKDILSFTPDKIIKAMSGKSVPGYMDVQECSEGFKNILDPKSAEIDDQNMQFLGILSIVSISLVAIFLILMRK
jgi:hypothetical protein